MQILEASQIEKDPYLKLMVYGQPGVGKTFLGLNTSLRVAYICGEWEQARSTWQVLAERKVLNAGSKVFVVTSIQDMREAIKYLLDHPGEFDLVVLDNLTEIQEFIKVDLIDTEKKRDLNVLNIGEWQVLVDKTISVVKACRDIPNTHFVCIAHFGETYDERQQRFIRPSVLGKSLPSRLSATLNLVGYLHATPTERGVRRELVFSGATNILTKPHSALRNIEYANLDFLIAKISGQTPRDASYLDWRQSSKSASLTPEEDFTATMPPPDPDPPAPGENKQDEQQPAKPRKGKKGSTF